MKLFILLMVLVAGVSGSQDERFTPPHIVYQQKDGPQSSQNDERSKPTIYVNYVFEVAMTKHQCESAQERSGAACVRTPEEMVSELRHMIESAVSQAPACKAVTFSDKQLSDKNFDEFNEGLSLSFRSVEIDKGDIDYRKAQWQLGYNKSTPIPIAEGPLTDPVKAARDFCAAANGQGNALLHRAVEIHPMEVIKVSGAPTKDGRFETVPMVLVGRHQKVALLCEDSYKAPEIEGGVVECP